MCLRVSEGKNLFVPKLDAEAPGKMDFLRVHGEDDLASFPAGLWGIKEPPYQWQGRKRECGLYTLISEALPRSDYLLTHYAVLSKDSEGLDLILLPGMLSTYDNVMEHYLMWITPAGVAFDRSLSRLGHGKGYYDRFISTYTSIHGQKPLLGECYLSYCAAG